MHFQQDFYGIKERAQQEKLSLGDESDHTSSSNCPTDEKPQEENQPLSAEQAQVPQPHCSSIVEREMVEVKELVQTLQTEKTHKTDLHNTTPLPSNKTRGAEGGDRRLFERTGCILD